MAKAKTKVEKIIKVVHVWPDGSQSIFSVSIDHKNDVMELEKQDGDSIWIPLSSAEALRDAISEVLA